MQKIKINSVVWWAGHTALGYAACLLLSPWLPLGLHRVVMRRSGWWLFPSVFLLAVFGAAGFLYVSNSRLWALAIAPYMILLVHDVLSMWSWAWPFEWKLADKVSQLNARFSISLHLSVTVVLAVLIWLGVQHG